MASSRNQAAINKPSAFTDDIAWPLLSKDGATVATSINSDDRDQVVEVDGKTRPKASQIMKSVMAILVSAAGAVASIFTFILSPAVIVYVAGSICLMHFPMVTYKERRIVLLPSRKKAVDQLQNTAQHLKAEAAFLEEEVEYLLGYVSRFGDVEAELQELARSQGYSIDQLVQLIRENAETMDLMRENLRQKVITDVIEIVIRSEKGSNQVIDRVEAKLLALKITVKLEAYGITFDEDKFLQAVARNPTLWGVAGTVRKLLPPDEEQVDDSSVSVASDSDIYDMFYMSRGDQQQRQGSAFAVQGRAPGNFVSLAKRPRLSTTLESRQVPSSQ